MYLDRPLAHSADEAYWAAIDVIDAFTLPYAIRYVGVAQPAGRITLTRTDRNPAHTHHLVLRVHVRSVVQKVRVGADLHLSFVDLGGTGRVESEATIDAGDIAQFGGALYQSVTAAYPVTLARLLFRLMRGLQTEYVVGDVAIPLQRSWTTTDAFASGLGPAILRTVAEALLDDIEERLTSGTAGPG